MNRRAKYKRDQKEGGWRHATSPYRRRVMLDGVEVCALYAETVLFNRFVGDGFAEKVKDMMSEVETSHESV